jgi:hypothetical protein
MAGNRSLEVVAHALVRHKQKQLRYELELGTV